MNDLATWLRAQLDEDERVARLAIEQAGATEWASSAEGTVYDPNSGGNGYLATGPWGTSLDYLGLHIAHWDPARVLAEVDAKRQRLDWIESELGDDSTNETVQWLTQLEALPYADRPGYRPEWRP